jgi:uncharacterized MnhB-related membrane protein
MKSKYLLLTLMLLAVGASADNSTLDAAIGGGIGGAAGAAIGNELGGRDGAIIGGSVGAAIGTAVNTNQGPRYVEPRIEPHHIYSYPQPSYPRYGGGHPGYHCPPGQAKKGRC